MLDLIKQFRNGHRPSWWANTAYPFAMEALADRYFSHFPRSRCEVMTEDWDTLIILDACRYDLFEEVSDWGPLDARLSKGSNTGEFFERNFEGTQHYDTVYVTANPVPRVEEWCTVDVDSVFHDVVDVWEDQWDTDVNTVRPEPVAEAVRLAHEQYPNKRIIGHFIQPHQPFIGSLGQQIGDSGMMAYRKIAGKETEEAKQVWKRLENGDISRERTWAAYAENLELVLPHVREFVTDLAGKTVVTADHGNLLGEVAWPIPVRRYGHPRGIHTKHLIKVPWVEIEHETRREVTTDPPVATESESDRDTRRERLEHLGYR